MWRALGLETLVRSSTVAPPPPGVDAARAGTAIDFRVRVALGGFDPYDSVAAQGVALLPLHSDEVENGSHRIHVLAEAFDVAVHILAVPSDYAELDRACLLLAHCEQVYRAGASALTGSLGAALDAAESGVSFARQIDEPSLVDLRALMEGNAGQLELWRERVGAGDRFDPNPSLSGSALVDGADADWIIGDTLVESKAYETLTMNRLRDFLRQLLGYVLLDLDDALGIRSVGVWLPRQGLMRSWSLDRLLDGDAEVLLPKLRKGFRSATSGTHLAVRELATQRRKHQLLADNRHTPIWMLIDLEASDDADIRFRVGRNPATPEQSLRRLAEDRYARVRTGVACNQRAPIDLLNSLRQDSSVVVRRAVEANPRISSQSALTREGVESQQRMDIHVTTDDALVAAEPADTPGKTSLERDAAALDSRWFAELLDLVRGGAPWTQRPVLPISKASQLWAMNEGRSREAPEWLRAGLPEAVRADLFLEHRPAWVRRSIAWDFPIDDPGVRRRLLADADPVVRWEALQRTVDSSDDALAALLGRLATDRNERKQFRRAGGVDSGRDCGRTPTELDRETLSLVASHPATPREALERLLASTSPNVLIGLATNPALTANDLTGLLPRLTAIRSYEQRERLAASPRIAPVVALALVGDRNFDVRVALARNGATPGEALDKLAADDEHLVRCAVVANPSTPTALATAVADLLLDSSVDDDLLDALRAASRRVDLSLSAERLAEAIDRLSRSRVRDPDMRLIAAGDERAASPTLARLARSADDAVRSAVAENPSTPADVLALLASHVDPSIRSSAAGNEALALDQLGALARDDDAEVRANAAGNPRLDQGTLAELLRDDVDRVRWAASQNTSTRPEDQASAETERERAWRASAPSRADLEELVASRRAEVRMQVAYDSRTPPDVLVFLSGDRRSAQVRRAVAANPYTPGETLASLADDADSEVRQAVAFNSATPTDTLVRLASRGVDLALLVALNPNAPWEVMDVLSGDQDPLVNHVATGARADRRALWRGDVAMRGRARIGC